jgi:PrtD family type I secretion system ABC transporter
MASFMSFGAQKRYDPVRLAIAANRRLFVAAFAFSGVMSILALTTSFYMLEVYDRVLSSRSIETLILLTVIATVALAVFSVLDSLRLRLLQRIGMRVAETLSATVLRAMVATTSQNGGTAIRTGLRDVETIKNFIGSPGLGALIDAPFTVVFMFVLVLLHPLFLVVVLLGGAVLVAIALVNQRTTNPPLTQSIQLQSRAHEFVEDGLRNADVLEGMGMSSNFVSRWRKQWLDSLVASSTAADRDSKLSALSRGVRLLIQVLLLGTGALLILDFQATGGIMIGASIIGARALAPIEAIVSTWKSVIAVRLAWDRLVALLERAPKRDEGMQLPTPQGRLQANSVTYYPPGSRKPILSNISFEVGAGEALGIIGPSGSGKSTLLRVLIGAWPCAAGVVRLDSADIFAWPRAELSKYVGYLPQDVELFHGSVKDNIARMGAVDPEEVVHAAQRAGAHDMILALPKGYDTDIGDYGHKLSGGQSQRIGIARTLYNSPRFVVLDEPNSNLDAMGERALFGTLNDLKQRKTTVVIVAHSPNILSGVDKLLVLSATGTVADFGPRAEVIQRMNERANQQRQANVVPLSNPPAGGPGRSGVT